MSKVACITPKIEGKEAKCAAAKESMAKLWNNRFLTEDENLKTGLAHSMCAGNEKEMDSIFWRMKDPKDPNYYKRNEFITETYDETLSPPQAHRLAGTAWSTSELETLWKKKGLNSIEELSGKFGKSYHEIFLKLEDMADPTSTSHHSKVLGRGKKDKEKKEKVKRGMPSSVAKAVAQPDQKETFEVSESQMRALKAIASRKSVFYTGAAGTGKSFITGVLKKMLDHLNLTKKLAVTAPTGVAACNVGGMTIHSWAGVGLGDKPVEKLVGAIRGMQKQGGDSAYRRWKETDILVIDEISMLGADLFEKVSQVGMHIRNDFTMPFGGIQLILCGDFFQLPPVSKGKGAGNLFAFSTETWRLLLPDKEQSVVLDKVFRQKDGPLLRILNSMRRGVVTQEAKEVLNRKVSEYQQEIAVRIMFYCSSFFSVSLSLCLLFIYLLLPACIL
jgi:DNA replication protein DnaC